MITFSNRCVPNFNDPRAVCMVNTTASQITALWFVPSFWQKAWLTRYFSPVCLPWPNTSTILFLKLPSRVICFWCDSPDTCSWNNHTLAYLVRHCLSSLLRPLRFCFRCLNFPQTESRQSLQKVKRRHFSSSRTTGSTGFVAKLRGLRAAGWWWTGVELAERSSTVSCRTRWR